MWYTFILCILLYTALTTLLLYLGSEVKKGWPALLEALTIDEPLWFKCVAIIAYLTVFLSLVLVFCVSQVVFIVCCELLGLIPLSAVILK